MALKFKRIATTLCILSLFSQGLAQEHTLKQLLETPYVSNLTVANNQSVLAFTVNRGGQRNVYMAKHPEWEVKQVTAFIDDDGLEISSLQLSPDGKWAVFAKGGDHGANSLARPTNAASSVQQQHIQLFSVALPTATLRQLGQGDFPVIHPDGHTVTYLKGNQAWTVPIDGSKTGEPLFPTRGSVRNFRWSADGGQLLFTARRGTHSFIGIFSPKVDHIRWIAPAFCRDDYPVWSPDGNHVAFIRRPGIGGAIDSLLQKKHHPWSIMVANVATGDCTEIWKAPPTLKGSVPVTQGGFNLYWPQAEWVTFTSYQDGWPHLYAVSPDNKQVRQLTKGNFAIEHISYSTDGQSAVFSANTGTSALDKDRKHIGTVSIHDGKQRMQTDGAGMESFPLFINQDQAIVALQATAKRPLLPVIHPLDQHVTPIVLGEHLLHGVDFGKLIVPEQVQFRAEDGMLLHGQLFMPQTITDKIPAVVYIHGGPRRQMLLGWHFMDYYFYDYAVNQYLASQGIAVLVINYRMGTGYGFDFQNPPNTGNQGASEYLDILAAGKWLAQHPDIDPAQIGVFGGSYGGYLTAMALGKNSDLFKAGVDIHGVHNRTLKHDMDRYPPDFEEAARLAWESSPSKWVDGWTSPVLIIHGDDDQNVAFSQSIDLVNRLRACDVDVSYLAIPDETHHWMRFENLLKVKQATVDFLKNQLQN